MIISNWSKCGKANNKPTIWGWFIPTNMLMTWGCFIVGVTTFARFHMISRFTCMLHPIFEWRSDPKILVCVTCVSILWNRLLGYTHSCTSKTRTVIEPTKWSIEPFCIFSGVALKFLGFPKRCPEVIDAIDDSYLIILTCSIGFGPFYLLGN